MVERIERLAENVTLYLGDCRDIVPTLPRPAAVITDPPYGMAFRSNHRLQRHETIANDADAALLVWACGVPCSHSRYVFCRWDNLQDVPKPKSFITWVKNNWSMGDLEHEHARQTEGACFYPGEAHSWPDKRPTDVVYARRTGNDNHPSEKPVSLMEVVLGWTSGSVLDPFMGSGTTGVAAVRLGRPFVGVELESAHFDTACRRIAEELSVPRFDFDAPRPSVQTSLLDYPAAQHPPMLSGYEP